MSQMKKILAKIILIVVGVLVLAFALPKTQSFQKNNKNLPYEELNVVDEPQAILLLFAGGGGDPRGIDKKTLINEVAQKYKIQCIAIPQHEFFFSDSTYQNIKSYLTESVKRYNIPNNNIFLGGFSFGGFRALRYAEMSFKKQDSLAQPKAVFTIDPPVDYELLYQYCIRELNRSCANDQSGAGKAEANWVKNLLEKNLGKLPDNREKYQKHSVFSLSDSTGGNAVHLNKLPFLSFHELNLMKTMEDKCRDIRDANIQGTSPMLNLVQQLGNSNALIKLTQNKGVRADGTIHPHSWSIADPEFTIKWLLQFIDIKN